MKNRINELRGGAKDVASIIIAALLVIAMQLVQSGNEIPSFKFWICFVVIVFALIYIVYVAFSMARYLLRTRNQAAKLQKQLDEMGKQDVMTTKIEQ